MSGAPAANPADIAGNAEQAVPAVQTRSLYRFFRAGEEETLALQGVSLAVAPGAWLRVELPGGGAPDGLAQGGQAPVGQAPGSPVRG